MKPWLAGCLSLLSVACGKPYVITRLAVPNPFTVPSCRIALEQPRMDALRIGDKTPAQYLSEKDDRQGDSFKTDVAESLALFSEAATRRHAGAFVSGGQHFTLRPTWVSWEPGFYAYFASHAGEAVLAVDVLDNSGAVIEQLMIHTAAGDFSTGGRMRRALRWAGDALDAYVEERVSCARK